MGKAGVGVVSRRTHNTLRHSRYAGRNHDARLREVRDSSKIGAREDRSQFRCRAERVAEAEVAEHTNAFAAVLVVPRLADTGRQLQRVQELVVDLAEPGIGVVVDVVAAVVDTETGVRCALTQSADAIAAEESRRAAERSSSEPRIAPLRLRYGVHLRLGEVVH